MHPLHCPHCGTRAMTYGEKLTLGPMSSRGCAHCGRAVSVAWSSVITLAPALVAIPFAVVMWPSNAAMLLAAIGGGATLYLHARRAPLVGR